MSADPVRLYAMSTDDLYEELGRAVTVADYPRGGAIARPLAIERGRAFLSNSLGKLKTKICADWQYCNKRGAYGNFQSLAYAISPLISGVVGVPSATAMIVAIILIKIGLDDLCNCSRS